jgi:hypothetical protein
LIIIYFFNKILSDFNETMVANYRKQVLESIVPIASYKFTSSIHSKNSICKDYSFILLRKVRMKEIIAWTRY